MLNKWKQKRKGRNATFKQSRIQGRKQAEETGREDVLDIDKIKEVTSLSWTGKQRNLMCHG